MHSDWSSDLIQTNNKSSPNSPDISFKGDALFTVYQYTGNIGHVLK